MRQQRATRVDDQRIQDMQGRVGADTIDLKRVGTEPAWPPRIRSLTVIVFE